MSKADEMYSEEELKAIETIKKDNEYFEKHNIKTNASILLNLIEKQQKEIENMAEFIWKYDCCEHFKKEDENFKCEGWYINRECRENCIKPHFRKEII